VGDEAPETTTQAETPEQTVYREAEELSADPSSSPESQAKEADVARLYITAIGGAEAVGTSSEDEEARVEELAALTGRTSADSKANFRNTIEAMLQKHDGVLSNDGQTSQHIKADPILLFNGQYLHTADDIRLNGAGIDFVFRRTYRSQTVYSGPLGASWDHNFNLYARESALGLVLKTGDLRDEIYTRHPRFGEEDYTYFVPPDGIHAVFLPSGNSFTRRTAGGVRQVFERDPNWALGHRLLHIEDRYGNRLWLEYADGRLKTVFVNHAKRWVEFEYDTVGRIMLARDHTLRVWRYEYDDWGDLIAHTTPPTDRYPSGLTTTYDYSSALTSGLLQHSLIRIVDPAGRAYLENEYGSAPGTTSFNHVIRQRQGGGESFIEYETVVQPFEHDYTDAERPAFQTNFFGRNGHAVHDIHNQFGNLLQKEEQVLERGRMRTLTWRYRYNQDGALTSLLSPEGSVTQYYLGREAYLRKYGITDAEVPAHASLTWRERLAFGRTLAVVRRGTPYTLSAMNLANGFWGDIFPDVLSAADPADIVTKFTYEPDYGQVVTASDPRFTGSADPNSVEGPAYTATLTRYEYTGPPGDPSRLLARVVHPEPTWPDGSKAGPVIEQFVDYDDHGRLRRGIDPAGGITELQYFLPADEIREGYLRRRIVDPGGLNLVTEYEIDDLGRATAVQTPRGVAAPGRFVTHFEYNALDQIVRVVASPPFQYVTRFFYNPSGKLERQERDAKDESGADLPDAPEVRTFTYDEQLNVLSESIGGSNLAAHLFIRHCYDNSDKLVATILPNGNRVRRRYDERLQEIELTIGAGTPDAATVGREYDGDGRLRRLVSPRGFPAEFSTDVLGRTVESRDALGHVTRDSYDKANNLIVRRSFELRQDGSYALLARTGLQYDELNRRIAAARNLFDDPLPAADIETDFLASPGPGRPLSDQAFYDANSRFERTVDPLGRVSTFQYDPARRLHLEEDPAGNRVFYTWDDDGNLVRRDRREAIRDPINGALLGERVFAESRSYDELERLSSLTDSLGNVSTYQYDSRGSPARTVDPLGNVKRAEFDIYGRPNASIVEMTDTGLGGGAPLSPLVTQYGYDGNGNLTSITDPLGRKTIREFDALDRWRRTTYPNLSASEFQYDADGNLISTKDNNGLVRTRTIDPLGQVTRVDIDRKGLPGWITVEGADVETYSYDGLGRLRDEQNDFARRQTRLNSVSWAITETVTFTTAAAPMLNVLTLGRKFDDAGSRTGVVYPEGREVRYTRNALGQVASIDNLAVGLSYPGSANTPDQHPIAAFDYTGLQRASARWGNGAGTEWRYDGNGRTIEIRHSAAGPIPELRLQQLFDAAGSVRLRNDLTMAANDGEVYRYDSAYRLTRLEHVANPPIVDPDPLAPATIVPPEPIPHRQVDVDAHLGSLAQVPGTFTWLYDDAGNRREERPAAGPPIAYVVNNLDQYTAVNGGLLTYDLNGNLVGDGKWIYRYDSQNRLVRVLDAANGADITRFFPSATGGRILEISGGKSRHFLYDGPNVIAEYQAGVPSAQFVHDDGVDRAVEIAAEQTEHWYHADFVGSARRLTDRLGAPVGRYRYSPFGVMQSAAGPYNPIGYAGARRNAAIASYDCRARQYDPRLGRFLQRDPIGPADGTNLYTYVGNNPLFLSDPLGLKREHTPEPQQSSDEALMAARMIGEAALNLVTLGTYGAIKMVLDLSPDILPTFGDFYRRDPADMEMNIVRAGSGADALLRQQNRVAARAGRGARESGYYAGLAANALAAGVGGMGALGSALVPRSVPNISAGTLSLEPTFEYSPAGEYTFEYVAAGESEWPEVSYSTPKTPTGGPYWVTWEDYPKVSAFNPKVGGTQKYALVGPRLYSKEAVSRMQPSGFRYSKAGSGGFPQIQIAGTGINKPRRYYDYGRSVAPSFVESAIETSVPVKQPGGNIGYRSGSTQVIVSPEGRVVTIETF